MAKYELLSAFANVKVHKAALPLLLVSVCLLFNLTYQPLVNFKQYELQSCPPGTWKVSRLETFFTGCTTCGASDGRCFEFQTTNQKALYEVAHITLTLLSACVGILAFMELLLMFQVYIHAHPKAE